MIYKCANAYYFRNLNKIGGIESHLNYISLKYGEYEIVVFYKQADINQINRLKKNVRCIKLNDNDIVECDKLFCCFNREILEQCKAKEINLVLHGDYKAMVNMKQMKKDKLPIDERIDNYYGVSQTICDSWYELTGIKAKNLYQPIILEKTDKPLMFVSATRLTKEKGYNRMIKLAQTLNENNIKFTWFIYTDSEKTPIENVVFMKPRLDITDYLSGYDAFIQLSDNEGYCLSVVEAWLKGVPTIITDLPVLKELGANKDNSVILPLDMSYIPIDEIKNITKKQFTYKLKDDYWDDVLEHKPSDYHQKFYRIKALNDYSRKRIIDVELGRIPNQNEEWEVSVERLDFLLQYQREKKLKLVDVVE